MANSKNPSALVEFEHNGVHYSMTEAEIEAAYLYQSLQNRLKDAERQLDLFVFDYADDDVDYEKSDDPEVRDCKEAFREAYGLSYSEAVSPDMLKKYLQKFEDDFDCNDSENAQWHMAISAVLEEVKQ